MTDPIETVVRRVAEAFNWEQAAYGKNGRAYRVHESSGWIVLDGVSIIVLAAYAEAAIHDQGWMLHHDGSTSHSTVQLFHEAALQAGVKCRATNELGYKPSDPLSRAKAVLRAVDEAIGGGG